MTRTGKIVTAEQLAEVKRLHEKARNTPVIALSVGDGLAGRDFASLAWDELKKYVHKCAIDLGLPEIPGYYGMDTSNGEIVSE